MPFNTKDNLYTTDEIAHNDRSTMISKFILRKRAACQGTAGTFASRLAHFSAYIYRRHEKVEVDQFVKKLSRVKKGTDAYDVLADFCLYLQSLPNEHHISANHIRALTISAKKFLRFCGVAIDNETFREQVLMPRKEHPEKLGIDKATIVDILNACKDNRLKTALMFYASSGVRAVEATSLRWRDLNLGTGSTVPPTFTVRKEYSKMRVARTRPLTGEMHKQLLLWREYKFRKRWTTVKGERKYATPDYDPDSLVFSKEAGDGRPEVLYDTIQAEFGRLLDTIGLAEREDGGRRRKITINRFRSWVKTTYSDLGHSDFGEWFIGHAGSTYYRKSEAERQELFVRLSTYFTFLDAKQLQSSASDLQSQIDAMRREHAAEIASLKEQNAQEITALRIALRAKSYLQQQVAAET